MKHRMNDALVGLTVIAVTAALLVALAWVKQSDFGQHRREVVARVRDVGNTRVGNAVVIRGVVAGTVQAIELAPEGWVHVRMRLDRSVQLPADPVVLLNEASLFGEWQAAIESRSAIPADPSVRALIAEASGERGLLPGAAFPGIGKLTAVAGQIAGDVANVASRVQVAFDDSAARELRASFRNVSELSTVLAKTVRDHAGDLDTIAVQLRTAVSSINHAAVTVQRMADQADTSARTGDVRQIVDNVSAAAVELRRATTKVSSLADDFGQSQRRLDSFLANGDSILAKVNSGKGTIGLLVNDPGFYHRGDSLMVQLKALITDIRANPNKYVHLSIF